MLSASCISTIMSQSVDFLALDGVGVESCHNFLFCLHLHVSMTSTFKVCKQRQLRSWDLSREKERKTFLRAAAEISFFDIFVRQGRDTTKYTSGINDYRLLPLKSHSKWDCRIASEVSPHVRMLLLFAKRDFLHAGSIAALWKCVLWGLMVLLSSLPIQCLLLGCSVHLRCVDKAKQA